MINVTNYSIESVADYSQKPLYVVNCGDLGVDVNSIEENLSTITRLATSWNAIVLIDEADVFLEQRTAHDLKRNALVSSEFLHTKTTNPLIHSPFSPCL